jgi:hypothetical protein
MCDHSLHSVKSQPAFISNRCGSAAGAPGCCISGNAAFTELIWHQRFPGATLAFVNTPKLTETRYAIPAHAA